METCTHALTRGGEVHVPIPKAFIGTYLQVPLAIPTPLMKPP